MSIEGSATDSVFYFFFLIVTTPETPSGLRIERDEQGHIVDSYSCPRATRVQELASRFPSLDGIEGISPWDVETLTRKSFLMVSIQARHSIRFVLSVWSPDAPADLGIGAFDLHSALKAWDPIHRAAFHTWVHTPWWV